MKHLLTYCLACTMLASARTLVYNNYEFNGRPLLIPQVQQESYQPGFFTIPPVLTVEVPESESLIVEQLNAQLQQFDGYAAAPAAKGLCRFVLTTQGVPASAEGYTLKITEQDITVSSRDTAGLFYGAQTLRNMLRNARPSLPRDDHPEAQPDVKRNRFPRPPQAPTTVPSREKRCLLPCCELTDYPDFDLRGTGLTIANVPDERWNDFLQAVDALAGLKMNALRFNVAETFPYEGFKLAKIKNPYPRERLQALADFCHRRHMQVIPVIQVLSHTQWMTYHEDWDKMSEGKPSSRWNSQCCIQNEQARDITRMALEEQIAFFRPKIFYVCLDELSLGPFRSCPRCQAKPASELLRDYMTFLRDVVEKKHGVRIFICQDNLINKPNWPYGDTFRSNLTPNDLVNWWNYNDRLPVDTMEYFKDFDVNGHALSGKPFNMYNMLKLMKSYGKRSATTAYWYYSQYGTLYDYSQETPDSLGGSVIAADMMWHFDETHHYQDTPYDAAWEMVRRIYPDQAVQPRRQGRATPIPLNTAINSEISAFADMPQLDGSTALDVKQTLAALPENFTFTALPDGRYYGLQLSGSPHEQHGRAAIEIDLYNRCATAFSCLMTASPTTDSMGYYSAGVYGRKRLKYPEAASFTITYVNGTKHIVPARYRYDFTDWNRPFSGFGMRFGVRGLTTANAYFSFGIFDFTNPYPERPIKKLTFSTRRLDGVRPVLLALSAWDLDKPLKASREFRPDKISYPYRPIPAEQSLLHIIDDFEKDTGGVYLTYPPQLEGKITMERVADPRDPQRGTVLKVTVPPAERQGTGDVGAYVRVSVDATYTPTPKTKGLFFRYRIEGNPQDFSHGNQYLTERAKDQKDTRGLKHVLYRFPVNFNAGWGQIFTPLLDQRGTYKGTDFQKMKTRRISFFFKRISQPTVLYIDDIGDSESTQIHSTLSFFGPASEAEPL